MTTLFHNCLIKFEAIQNNLRVADALEVRVGQIQQIEPLNQLR